MRADIRRPQSAETSQPWRASLTLVLDRSAGRTVLRRARHSGPLRVQRPFYPEGQEVCHIYLLHPPGGLAGGDELDIDVTLGVGAAAVITTPAASKFYRTEGRRARQRVHCRVAPGACLDYVPQETLFFDDCLAETTLCVALDDDGDALGHPGAGFIGWDIVTLGRRASGQSFTSGSALSRFEIHRAGQPVWLDRAHFIGGEDRLHAAWGLRGHAVSGTMVCAGLPRGSSSGAGHNHPLRQALERQIERWNQPDAAHLTDPAGREHVTATCVDGVWIMRYLGDHARRALARFEALRSIIRPWLCKRPALAPRIWAT